jgi:hypothetical protein
MTQLKHRPSGSPLRPHHVCSQIYPIPPTDLCLSIISNFIPPCPRVPQSGTTHPSKPAWTCCTHVVVIPSRLFMTSEEYNPREYASAWGILVHLHNYVVKYLFLPANLYTNASQSPKHRFVDPTCLIYMVVCPTCTSTPFFLYSPWLSPHQGQIHIYVIAQIIPCYGSVLCGVLHESTENHFGLYDEVYCPTNNLICPTNLCGLVQSWPRKVCLSCLSWVEPPTQIHNLHLNSPQVMNSSCT